MAAISHLIQRRTAIAVPCRTVEQSRSTVYLQVVAVAVTAHHQHLVLILLCHHFLSSHHIRLQKNKPALVQISVQMAVASELLQGNFSLLRHQNLTQVCYVPQQYCHQ
jgi:hypothetical protein